MSTAKKIVHKITFSEYQSWPEGERWELIGGEPHAMSPSPTVRHQRLVMRTAAVLQSHFDGDPCEVFISPLDVRLSEEDVVEPDIMVVCDPDLVKEGYIDGPPNLVIEVLSPSTATRDMVDKMRLYAKYGVKEYWIVSPFPSFITVFTLASGCFQVAGSVKKGDTLESILFPDLALDLDGIFDFPLTEEEQHILDLQMKEPPAHYSASKSLAEGERSFKGADPGSDQNATTGFSGSAGGNGSPRRSNAVIGERH